MVDLTLEAMSEMQQLKDMGFGQSEAELAMQQANGQADFKHPETGYTSIRTTPRWHRTMKYGMISCYLK